MKIYQQIISPKSDKVISNKKLLMEVDNVMATIPNSLKTTTYITNSLASDTVTVNSDIDLALVTNYPYLIMALYNFYILKSRSKKTSLIGSSMTEDEYYKIQNPLMYPHELTVISNIPLFALTSYNENFLKRCIDRLIYVVYKIRYINSFQSEYSTTVVSPVKYSSHNYSNVYRIRRFFDIYSA